MESVCCLHLVAPVDCQDHTAAHLQVESSQVLASYHFHYCPVVLEANPVVAFEVCPEVVVVVVVGHQEDYYPEVTVVHLAVWKVPTSHP